MFGNTSQNDVAEHSLRGCTELNSLTIHVGMPKTGTSSLQRALASWQERCGEDKPVYPEGFRDSGGFAHHPLAHAVNGTRPDGQATLQNFGSYRRMTRDRALLISSEAFTNCISNFPFSGIREFLASCGATHIVRLVMVLRSIESFMESMYLQSAKAGKVAIDIAEYVATRVGWSNDVFCALRELEKTGAIRELICVEYTRGSGFSRALATALGVLDDEVIRQMAMVRNERLGLKAQTFFRFMSELELDYQVRFQRWPLIRAFEARRIEFEGEEYGYTILDRKKWDEIRTVSLKSAKRYRRNEYLAYFAGDVCSERPFRSIVRTNLTDRDLRLVIEFQKKMRGRDQQG